MDGDPAEPTPPRDPGDAAPLAPAGAQLPGDPRALAAALAAVLDQQGRDATAARTQARELIRAVDGLAKAHEFLGLELRAERRRSRVVALLALALPLLAVVALWAWMPRAEPDPRLAVLEQDVRALRDRDDTARVDGLRRDYEERLRAVTGDVDSLRTDLAGARASAEQERAAREATARDTAERLAAAERDRADLAGVRAELSALRDVAGAERARADQLARALADAARPDASPGAAPATAPVTGPRAPEAPPSVAVPATPAAGAAAAPAVRAPVPATREPAPEPRPEQPPARTEPPATRDAADLERIVSRLNSLLDGATGAARYQFAGVEGVSGTELLGVRVVGKDDSGRTLRTVDARRAEITVSEADGIRIRFTDGHLLVGGRKAPFFDGAYTLALDGAPGPWKESGLTCVRFR